MQSVAIIEIAECSSRDEEEMKQGWKKDGKAMEEG